MRRALVSLLALVVLVPLVPSGTAASAAPSTPDPDPGPPRPPQAAPLAPDRITGGLNTCISRASFHPKDTGNVTYANAVTARLPAVGYN
ncbi:hypothetical protein HCA58_18550 [Micromonospora sp. HNM0581]|uniref:hypothetical protein n=1 Tax=Micromonospora sp. HNM0581 TaxID=2716341 RepID=UPI00146DC3EA|nr:hypothetical protein [Micromonospora sp. HNM0581]NLU80341.1 hypothetical protein [Micromonospora sp. HNM0581]